MGRTAYTEPQCLYKGALYILPTTMSYKVSPQINVFKITYSKCFLTFHMQAGSTSWRSWLRHCIINRKVAGFVPDGVNGIFYNPTGRTMDLGLIQPLTEMSTRNISWEVKLAGA
jgi:hypothetical protein